MDVRKGCCTWNLNLGWSAEWKGRRERMTCIFRVLYFTCQSALLS